MATDLLNPVLNTPITSLAFSDEFKNMALTNGYGTVKDILKDSVSELPYKPASGFRTLKELMNFLTNHGLESLTED